jgi:hypothetical protein
MRHHPSCDGASQTKNLLLGGESFGLVEDVGAGHAALAMKEGLIGRAGGVLLVQ